VQLALEHRLKENGDTTARELLDWTICEPALGSGAFLNEAINQLAAEYLRRRQAELTEIIPPEDFDTELRKVKADPSHRDGGRARWRVQVIGGHAVSAISGVQGDEPMRPHQRPASELLDLVFSNSRVPGGSPSRRGPGSATTATPAEAETSPPPRSTALASDNAGSSASPMSGATTSRTRA
jgi:hypothetical protein